MVLHGRGGDGDAAPAGTRGWPREGLETLRRVDAIFARLRAERPDALDGLTAEEWVTVARVRLLVRGRGVEEL